MLFTKTMRKVCVGIENKQTYIQKTNEQMDGETYMYIFTNKQTMDGRTGKQRDRQNTDHLLDR